MTLDLLLDALTVAHVLLTLWVTLYGLNSLILVLLYWRYRRRAPACPPLARDDLPPVTLQLPLYNEKHVAGRLIDAVAALDYPRDRFQVQVLDDSTDETTQLVEARAAHHRERGLDIEVIHRAHREGSKAGAMAAAMPRARGALIAIFDADFRPHPDFLLRTVPHLVADPQLGMVQTRWVHLNAEYSLLTRVQALALDGHFVVEQTARSRAGLLMHFNGTAGVWRRACIEDSGGWQSDTLCEDLDLSFRAQMRGWRFRYLQDVESPSELPPQMLAFKQQQVRWAQGSSQCLRKLSGPLLRNPDLSLARKALGWVLLSAYAVFPLTILLLLLSLPAFLNSHPLQGVQRLLGPVCLGPILVYATSQWEAYPDWRRRLLAFPLMVLVGGGLAWNDTLGVWRGLRHWGGVMARTPKFDLQGREGKWLASRYRLTADRSVAGEVFLALYALATAIAAWGTGHPGAAVFPFVYALAFGTVAGVSLAEMRLPQRRRASVQPKETLS